MEDYYFSTGSVVRFNGSLWIVSNFESRFTHPVTKEVYPILQMLDMAHGNSSTSAHGGPHNTRKEWDDDLKVYVEIPDNFRIESVEKVAESVAAYIKQRVLQNVFPELHFKGW